MKAQIDENTPESDKGAGIDLEMSFEDAVKAFIAASPWLGPADLPALKLLHSLAKQLDVADEAGTQVQTYRMAQFNNLQQRLISRDPEAKKKRPAASDSPVDETAQMLDMFLNNPAAWKAPV